MLNNKFYKLIIQSNFINLLDNIINKLNNNIKNNNYIIFNKPINLFKVLFNNILTYKEISEIFEYNPLQLKQLINPISNDNNKIDITLYYECEMKKIIDNDQRIIMPNLYKLDKSQFYRDYINNEMYTIRKTLYIESEKKNTILSNCIYNNDILINNYNSKKSYPQYTSINKLFKKKLNLNCIFINVEDCGYDFLEFINIEDNKLLILIFPNENKKSFILGNFMNLDINSNKMLIALKNKYYNDNYLFFMHYQLALKNYTLHLHIIKKDYYKRPFPEMELELGSFILKALYFDKLINFYNAQTNYYKDLNKNLNFSIINPIF